MSALVMNHSGSAERVLVILNLSFLVRRVVVINPGFLCRAFLMRVRFRWIRWIGLKCLYWWSKWNYRWLSGIGWLNDAAFIYLLVGPKMRRRRPPLHLLLGLGHLGSWRAWWGLVHCPRGFCFMMTSMLNWSSCAAVGQRMASFVKSWMSSASSLRSVGRGTHANLLCNWKSKLLSRTSAGN